MMKTLKSEVLGNGDTQKMGKASQSVSCSIMVCRWAVELCAVISMKSFMLAHRIVLRFCSD